MPLRQLVRRAEVGRWLLVLRHTAGGPRQERRDLQRAGLVLVPDQQQDLNLRLERVEYLTVFERVDAGQVAIDDDDLGLGLDHTLVERGAIACFANDDITALRKMRGEVLPEQNLLIG